MKIIFAGTPDFSVPTLDALLRSKHEVFAVFTQPDRPAGRGRNLTMSPVKQLAQQHHLPIFQPETLRDAAIQDTIKNMQADVMVVVAYGLLLPKAVLALPKYGCINIHASLLPRWRGASPIQQAILAGDAETGVTIMQMEAGLDTGPELAVAKCAISPTDTAQSLHDTLSQLGAKLLPKTLDQYAALTPTPQPEAGVTYAPKINKTDALIDWQLPAVVIDRQIRGYNPWPIAYTHLDGTLVRLWQAQIATQPAAQAPPGTILATHKTGVDIATGDGVITLLRAQFPGHKPLAVGDILNAKNPHFQVGKRCTGAS